MQRQKRSNPAAAVATAITAITSWTITTAAFCLYERRGGRQIFFFCIYALLLGEHLLGSML